MERLRALLDGRGLAAPLDGDATAACAASLERLGAGRVYPRSLVAQDGALYFLTRRGGERKLGILAAEGHAQAGRFAGGATAVYLGDKGLLLRLCPADHANALALRQTLTFLTPRTLGLAKSAGCGDRLGLATPGHVRAVRGAGLAAIFAQQSIREMTRTQRTPEQVLDDATWGAFREGWREGYGADADHLKTAEDVDLCLRAGFTFYTIDPGDHVDNAAETDPAARLSAKVEALPWSILESTPRDLRAAYVGRALDLGPGIDLCFDEEAFLRAAGKYGRAIAHTVTLYRHLCERTAGQPFELEMSVDETAVPTKVAEHAFIACELARLGVRWVSLAPRYSGRFEKGVDYIGDLEALEREMAQHAAVARHLGPYKLSLHSGSDKFSVYPLLNRQAGNLVHLKTAGTSYLEALRAIAAMEPALMRELLAFARERYREDKASYHVSADPARAPDPARLGDGELPGLLDDFDTRQMLHVTFGSVLTTRAAGGGYRFRERLYAALEAHEEEHYAAIEAHFRRHLASFVE